MIKPVTYGDIYNGFSEQAVQVSISTDVINLEDRSAYKVYWQIEPEDIVPLEKAIISNHRFYDLILTWNENLLASCPNAEKFIFGTCRWAVDPKDDVDVSQKKFAVSYLTSSKTMCAGHYLRHEVFKALPDSVVKHMSPPEIDKQSMLYPFQFSIVMENSQQYNWITEKLIDCLVSRTIPIYWGAPNVGEYFNTKGIIPFNTVTELLGILATLTPDAYLGRLDAIEENLHKAMQYTNHHRRIDEIIKERLSEHHLRVSEHIGARQEVREPVFRQQPSESRRLHRQI
jgi:hypothetical protein